MSRAFGAEERPLYLDAEEQLAAVAAAKVANPVRPSFAHKTGFTGKGEDERAVLLQTMTEEAEAVRAAAAASQAAALEAAAAAAAPDTAPYPTAEPSTDGHEVLDMHDDDDAAIAAPLAPSSGGSSPSVRELRVQAQAAG